MKQPTLEEILASQLDAEEHAEMVEIAPDMTEYEQYERELLGGN